MDALAAVLAVASVRGTVAATLSAAEPWGLALAAVPGAAFHAVTDGIAWLRIAGHPDTRLMPGDVVLLPTGAAHVLASTPGADTVPFDHLAAQQALAPGDELRLGTGIAQTRILCASYHQDPAISLPLLSLLPDVLHVPSSRAGTGLDTTLRLLAQEITRPQPGTAAVLNRIVDILLVQLLRAWLDTGPERAQAASWLSALTDPVAGPALAVLHAEPGRDWTVASLAAAIGVSRATLARPGGTHPGGLPDPLAHGSCRRAPARHRRHGRRHRQIPRLHLGVRVQPRLHPGSPDPARPLPHPARRCACCAVMSTPRG